MIREFPSVSTQRYGANNPHRTCRSVLKFSWEFNTAILVTVSLILALGVWAQS
jgi:hypothetical protein